MEELRQAMVIVCQLIVIIYMVHLPVAIIITQQQRKMGMKVEDAPNELLGIIYQLITVWAVLPIYTVKKLLRK